MAAHGGAPPIVAVTADVVDDVRERCADAGMQHYLSKPVRWNELSSLLEKLLGGAGDTAAR